MQRGIIDLQHGDTFFEPVTDYSAYWELAERTKDTFNDELSKLGVPLRVSTDAIKRALEDEDTMDELDQNGLISGVVRALQRGDIPDGILHEPQIRTVCQVLATIYRDLSRCVALLGAMQTGKTGTSNGCEFIPLALYLLTGRKYYAVTLLTNRRSHTQQTLSEYRVFEALFGRLTFVNTETSEETDLLNYNDAAPRPLKMTLLRYRKAVLSTATARLPAECDLDGYAQAHNIFPKEKAVGHQQRSNDKKRLKIIHSLCRTAEDLGFHLLFKIDEVHWGAGAETLKKRTVIGEDGTPEIEWYATESLMANFLKEIRDDLASMGGQHIFIGFSATPYHIAYLDNVNKVRQRLGPGYVGPNFALGEALDPTQGCILPNLRSIAEQCDLSGVRASFPAKDLSLSLYRNTRQFTRWRERDDTAFAGDHDDYRAEFRDAVARMIHQVLIDDRLGDPRPVALCLRAMNNNGEAEEFARQLGLSADIHVENYNCESPRGGKSIKDFVKSYCQGKKRILLVVTGSARMADAYPTVLDGQPCRWAFLDLTTKTTMQSSLLQSFYGRACGYGKLVDGEPPVVIVSEANYDSLRRYERSLGRIVMPPAPGAVAINQRRGRQSNQLPLLVSMNPVAKDRTIMRAFGRLQTVVDSFDLNNKELTGRTAMPTTVWSKCFTPSVLDHIQNVTLDLFPDLIEQVSLLRPVPTEDADWRGPFYHLDEGGGYIGLRETTPLADGTLHKSGGGGDMTLRDARRLLPDSGNTLARSTLTRTDANTKRKLTPEELAALKAEIAAAISKGKSGAAPEDFSDREKEILQAVNASRPQVYLSRQVTKRDRRSGKAKEWTWKVEGILLRLARPSRERDYAESSLPTYNSIFGTDLVTAEEAALVARQNEAINQRRTDRGLPPIVRRAERLNKVAAA